MASDTKSDLDEERELLNSISENLATIEAKHWRWAGGPPQEDFKVKRPRSSWDWVYCTPLHDHTLVVRYSQPVRTDYIGLGYVLIAQGSPEYFIELRAKNWFPELLTEPDRTTIFSDTFCEVLTTGEAAKELFAIVRKRCENYKRNRDLQFQKEALEFLDNLSPHLNKLTADDWYKELKSGKQLYRGKIEDWEIEISYRKEDEIDRYELSLAQEDYVFKVSNHPSARLIFREIEAVCQVAGLRALRKALGKV